MAMITTPIIKITITTLILRQFDKRAEQPTSANDPIEPTKQRQTQRHYSFKRITSCNRVYIAHTYLPTEVPRGSPNPNICMKT